MLRSSGTATMVETRLLWVERILCWPSLEYDESWWLRGGGGTVGLTMHREPLERNTKSLFFHDNAKVSYVCFKVRYYRKELKLSHTILFHFTSLSITFIKMNKGKLFLF
jgi:hypothetical protein